MQTKLNQPKDLTPESEAAIAFLTKVSEALKQQRRHFDDAVVTHCIRLVNDYAEEDALGAQPDRGPGPSDSGRRH
jgi:hypothetical protein